MGANTPHAQQQPRLCVVTALLLIAGAAQAQTLPAPPVSPAPVVKYEYDAQGNPTRTTQAPGTTGFNFATTNTYDALNRQKDSTDARNGKTQFGYDGLDRPVQVTDPRNLVTGMGRNGLGDVTGLSSPDTGSTQSTYDAAGNLRTRMDSRVLTPGSDVGGVLATYSYDALNRLTGVVYTQSGATTQTYTWTYDQTGAGFSNGIGRLTSTSYSPSLVGFTKTLQNVYLSTTYATGTSQYAYDPQGRLLSMTQAPDPSAATLTVGYAYDAAGHVTGITYPSGHKVGITYTNGLPSAINFAKDTGTTPQTLLSQIALEPFGGVKGWQWQMATGTQAYDRVRDTYGRLLRYRLGNTIRDITYDAGDRIAAYIHYDATTAAATPALDQSFGYDELGRLTSITTGTSTWAIGYDANGNRTGVTLNGSITSYTTETASNRLTAVSNPARSLGYDAVGNTLTDTGASTNYTAVYDLSNRLAQMSGPMGATSFVYDASGQRVLKSPTPMSSCVRFPQGNGQPARYVCTRNPLTAGIEFVYDPLGQLLGEYDSTTGATLREYVWLGSTPVAMITPDPANANNPPMVFYIHTDHLDTPRVVVDQNNAIRWRWLAEPFGTSAPENNPSSLGAFTQNLRFPGQYADAETGLNYNYFRDYDASTGRYVQSDPIGLRGGINTYAYVQGNPLSYVDPEGLQGAQPAPMMRPAPRIPGPAGEFPYIRPEWNYPLLPEEQKLISVCVEKKCPVSQPPGQCSPQNPNGNPYVWSSGPFASSTGQDDIGCRCLRYELVAVPESFPVTLPKFNQNAGQMPKWLRAVLK